MLPPEIRCVVGIDVAKQAHVVCALEAPSGAIRHKPSRIEATVILRAILHHEIAANLHHPIAAKVHRLADWLSGDACQQREQLAFL